MLSGPFLPSAWLGAQNTALGSPEGFDTAEWVFVGLPYDGTCSYRPGSRFAPNAIRQASWGLETWSPAMTKGLEDIKFYDAGDLEFPFGNRKHTLIRIKNAATETLAADKKWFGIGGEHLVTYPVIQAYMEKYPDLAILHFDAHGDLRDDFLGETLSHATVMRRIVELTGPNRLVQVGIRSGPASEFDWMRKHDTLCPHINEVEAYKKRLESRPVFVTLDLDVLDPAVLPGTGTPEPGGFDFNTLTQWISAFHGLNVVGADVVELAPDYDPSGASTAVATKVIRELLLSFH